MPVEGLQKVVDYHARFGPQIPIFALFECISATLMLPALGALSTAMLAMQPRSRTLSFIQIAAGSVATIGPFLSCMVLAAALVRPGTSPQGLSLAAAIFADRSPAPILPRW